MTVAMLRVKNEARWIAEVLKSLKPCCQRVFLMDDHSTDKTASIASRRGARVFHSPFDCLDEARDKDWLLAKVAAECEPGTWVVCIDGDEILANPQVINELIATGTGKAYTFRVIYLWNDRKHERVDGVYGRFYRPSMFQLRPGLAFRRTSAGGNFHCCNVPVQCCYSQASDVVLLHLGYMHREDRLRKWNWYKAKDPGNRLEDGYRHMVQGDVPEVPATAKLLHAGPLEIRPLNVNGAKN